MPLVAISTNLSTHAEPCWEKYERRESYNMRQAEVEDAFIYHTQWQEWYRIGIGSKFYFEAYWLLSL